MTRADKITAVRLYLAPAFFILYLLPTWNLPFGLAKVLFPSGPGWTVPILWAIFIISEITDLLDGQAARRMGQVSDFGKLFDPFADVLVRITYFLCFVLDGILPVLILLPILYREFGIQFLRVLMMGKGVAMGARKGGKIKANVYMISGILALMAASVTRLQWNVQYYGPLKLAAGIVFFISMAAAIISFVDYLILYKKTR